MSGLSFTAVIFDLDGVVTRTAAVHSKAWKEMFDEYLQFRGKKYGEPFREFTHDQDYLSQVDGKPRYAGVAAFLKTRGIKLPWGEPQDAPEVETICGLGNRKNLKFREIIVRDGVDLYESTIALVKALKGRGIRVGVASSSKNCQVILEAAGIGNLFEVCIDGIFAEQLHLQGKPEPDIFTMACDHLAADYARSVVIEDAISGVQAGAKGNFGLVIGVARENNATALKVHGADIVVKDLSEIDVDDIETWFREGLPIDQWSINYYDYVPDQERTREALCTVGNGYFGTRGAAEESRADAVHYPGTYLAAVYNRLTSIVEGRTIVHEDLVNCPNWLPVQFRIEEDPWIDLDRVEVLQFHRCLDLRGGVLKRHVVIRDRKGRETRILSRRVASMADPHQAALQYTVTPINYAARITFRAGIVWDVVNAGVERYRALQGRHLRIVSKGGDKRLVYVLAETVRSRIRIAEASSVQAFMEGEKIRGGFTFGEEAGFVFHQITVRMTPDQTFTLEKLAAIYASGDGGWGEPLVAAKKAVASQAGYGEVEQASGHAWAALWDTIDIQLDSDRLVQKLLRLHMYHLLTTRSIHHNGIDWGIPARGLHGEAYRGHIFWDEVFCLPFYNLHFPATAKAVLLYRYRRLDRARHSAREAGYQGAMFPWQSGSDGREVSQQLHLNPISNAWDEDHSQRQRHVSIAIVYNIWMYYWITGDLDFIVRYGAEIFFEIARFWSSMAVFDPQAECYVIADVMGPDEYHEGYPGAVEAGLKNNSYTNIMVAWLLGKAQQIDALLPPEERLRIRSRLALDDRELSRWAEIKEHLALPASQNGIIAQFEGFFELADLDWERYHSDRSKVCRLDRILKAAGDSPNRYQVLKQADVLMVFYLLPREEWQPILEGFGLAGEGDLVKRNFDYYYPRTSHGSTLSYIVHAVVAHAVGYAQLGWQLFRQSLISDYRDIQEGTTGEGIHTGVMAGTIMQTIKGYAGVDCSLDYLRVNPRLPRGWKTMQFSMTFRQTHYRFRITGTSVTVQAETVDSEPVGIEIAGRRYRLNSGELHTYSMSNSVTGVTK